MSILKPLILTALLAVIVTGAPVSAPAVSEPMTAALAAPAAAGTPAVETPDAAALAAEERRAQEALSGLSAKYEYLEGVSVIIGRTPNGEEAVAYYTEGRIVIDVAHSVSIDAILEHEVWHVIDWRDNGRIDWGEDLPPADSALYVQ